MRVAQLAMAFLAVNCAAFVAFHWDKQRAKAGGWRISENTLLWLALAGGSIGAIGAQHIFRHKTRKEPFRSILYSIAGLQALCLLTWTFAPDLFPALLRRY